MVKDGTIVGQGFHEVLGGPHAEVNALADAGEAARGATLYVTLEPCNHHGLTPPCTNAVLEAGGQVVGVIIPSMNTVALAHTGLTQMDVVEGMHARKARMHELADGYIAMPGGFGTFDELFETVTWAQTGAHEKPVGLFNVRNYYAPLLAAIDHAVQEGFIFQEHRDVLFCEADPDVLIRRSARLAAKALLDPNHPDGRAVEPIEHALSKARRERGELAELLDLLGQTGAPRDVVVLNAAAALWTAGRDPSPLACAKMATETIDSSSAARLLDQWRLIS